MKHLFVSRTFIIRKNGTFFFVPLLSVLLATFLSLTKNPVIIKGTAHNSAYIIVVAVQPCCPPPNALTINVVKVVMDSAASCAKMNRIRSEERRVGKECR